MTEIKLMKMEHSEWIPELDDDIRDYIFLKYACKKQQWWPEQNESTLESNPKPNSKLKNLFDLIIYVKSSALQCDKCIVCHTGVKWASCSFHFFFSY